MAQTIFMPRCSGLRRQGKGPFGWPILSRVSRSQISKKTGTVFKQGGLAVSLEEVKKNFARYGLLDEKVRFLKGFFSKTLPGTPIAKLSVLRADADLYESTRDVLEEALSQALRRRLRNLRRLLQYRPLLKSHR